MFDLNTFKADRKFAPGASTKSATFTPDERHMITGDRAGMIMVWNLLTQIPVELPGKGTIHTLAVRPDSKQFASAGSDGVVKLWTLPAKRNDEAMSLEQHSGPVYGVAYSPNVATPRLASAGWDGSVRIWDPVVGKQLRVLKGHEGDVFSVSFGKGGTVLGSAGSDGTVRIWDVESGTQLQVLRGGGRAFHTVRFAPDGKTLAVGGRDGNVRVWEIE